MFHLAHPYMTTGKTIAFTRWTFVGKAMSLLFNVLSGFSVKERGAWGLKPLARVTELKKKKIKKIKRN